MFNLFRAAFCFNCNLVYLLSLISFESAKGGWCLDGLMTEEQNRKYFFRMSCLVFFVRLNPKKFKIVLYLTPRIKSLILHVPNLIHMIKTIDFPFLH